MTDIVIPIFVRDPAAALAEIRAVLTAGANGIELRCDHATPIAITEVLAAAAEIRSEIRPGAPASTCSFLVTIRPTWEGGGYEGEESARHAGLIQAVGAGADVIDIELVAWQKSPALRAQISELKKTHAFSLILSNHDFTGRPADLLQRLAALRQEKEVDILKLVWKAASVLDAIEALRLTQEHSSPVVITSDVSVDLSGHTVHEQSSTTINHCPLLALAMGEPGQMSRLLGAKFGAPFTFATLPASAGSAPGQPNIQDLLATYRWAQQKSDTQVFGVVGYPVGHSLSPHIHNAGFDHIHFNGVYVPLLIEPTYDAFAAVVDSLRACPGMNLRGLSITIPHKENALRYVRERGGHIDPLSAHIGVINTILFPAFTSRSGSATLITGTAAAEFRGFNSDYPGALNALADALAPTDNVNPQEALIGRRVAVLGAGGAARAIVAGLASAGAVTTIFNRTPTTAVGLAKEFDSPLGPVTAAALEELPRRSFDIYINCTPLGMHPHVHASPIPAEMVFPPHALVFDTIYNPLETRLLAHARSQGVRTLPGMEMFVRQAAVQFEQFTGENAPVALFWNILQKALSGRT